MDQKFFQNSPYSQEPIISVGLLEDVPSVVCELVGDYRCEGRNIAQGVYRIAADGNSLRLFDSQDTCIVHSHTFLLSPAIPQTSCFTMQQVTIGKQFHWERSFNQKFKGDLILIITSPGRITAINSISLETYLMSVISSEMSPENSIEFVKAHCIVSRSWLMHQLIRENALQTSGPRVDYTADEVVCWTDREAHSDFDVCADDHCQRYQGLGQVNTIAEQGVQETQGGVLVYADEICDTRYAKCCGGRTENFSTAWENRDIVYLKSITDWSYPNVPLTVEEDAQRFILSQPDAYCKVTDRIFLRRILPEFDFETKDFFRWTSVLSQSELGQILFSKTGIDFGEIKDIIPLARGDSGRLYKIKVCGTRQDKIVGKELEIRRILSPTHLLSSAFVVERLPIKGGIPQGFRFSGAGWGHGVGLCQIGAAVMAEQGKNYQEILNHYFPGTQFMRLY